MDQEEEIRILIQMDKSPDEIVVEFGYPKELVYEIFEREFLSVLENEEEIESN